MVSLLRNFSTSSGWNNSLAASVTVDDGLSATKERIARSRSPIGTVYRMTSLLYDCSQKILRPVLICVVVIVTTEMVGTLSSRYRRSPARNRDSFLALADTLLRNFTISDLKELDVDCDLMREVASSHSHLPLAAMLVSKLQTAQPTQVSNVINIQDSVINRSEIG